MVDVQPVLQPSAAAQTQRPVPSPTLRCARAAGTWPNIPDISVVIQQLRTAASSPGPR
ncbi:hypothetical protein [Kitasatospora sp. NPDC087315]|uniref:hypothetical protein n=1 Tax=Kitasatospora sp. NPDC087315 TaxID=3364069 RepID=UPI0037F3C47A